MSDDCIYFQIRKTVRVSFNKKTEVSHIEYWENDADNFFPDPWDQDDGDENGHWMGLIIPPNDLPALKDALEKIEKLLPLL